MQEFFTFFFVFFPENPFFGAFRPCETARQGFPLPIRSPEPLRETVSPTRGARHKSVRISPEYGRADGSDTYRPASLRFFNSENVSPS